MQFRRSIPIPALVLFLWLTQPATANEMQRLVFNAGCNIGIAVTIRE
jgi:hypothetical protein